MHHMLTLHAASQRPSHSYVYDLDSIVCPPLATNLAQISPNIPILSWRYLWLHCACQNHALPHGA